MLKPVYDLILVKVEGHEEKTKSGIIIPEVTKAKKTHMIGEVIAAGPGKDKDTPIGVEKGERVMYRAGGWPITIENVTYQMINSTLLLGVMEDPNQNAARADVKIETP
jgi:chaperonin GroES